MKNEKDYMTNLLELIERLTVAVEDILALLKQTAGIEISKPCFGTNNVKSCSDISDCPHKLTRGTWEDCTAGKLEYEARKRRRKNGTLSQKISN